MAAELQKIDTKKLLFIARCINGEENEGYTKRMVTGFLVHNSSLMLSEIGKLFKITSIGYLWEVIFSDHKTKRDGDEDYRSKYYSLCKEMGVKNRL